MQALAGRAGVIKGRAPLRENHVIEMLKSHLKAGPQPGISVQLRGSTNTTDCLLRAVDATGIVYQVGPDTILVAVPWAAIERVYLGHTR